MIVNLERFHSMILQMSKTAHLKLMEDQYKLHALELLGINIDNKLTFYDHVSGLCNKVSMQLNTKSRFKRYFGKNELEVITNSLLMFQL